MLSWVVVVWWFIYLWLLWFVLRLNVIVLAGCCWCLGRVDLIFCLCVFLFSVG